MEAKKYRLDNGKLVKKIGTDNEQQHYGLGNVGTLLVLLKLIGTRKILFSDTTLLDEKFVNQYDKKEKYFKRNETVDTQMLLNLMLVTSDPVVALAICKLIREKRRKKVADFYHDFEYYNQLQYLYSMPRAGTLYAIDPEDVLHYLADGDNGYEGVSIVKYAAKTLQRAASADQYETAVYTNNARPGGILHTDADIGGYSEVPDPEHPGEFLTVKENIRRTWERAHGGGANAFRVAILDNGLKYEPIKLDAFDTSFVTAKDISVAGFDDTPSCEQVVPTLTSVRQDGAQRAEIAIRKILEMKEQKSVSTTTHLPVKLVERESTGKPKV